MKEPKPASWIQKIPPYVAGTSKDTIMERYGIRNPIKLASNENPLGPSPMAVSAAEAALQTMHLYPDPDARELRNAAAEFFCCRPEQIIAGNGSDEILDFICRAYLEPGEEVLIPSCTFSYYRIASLACGAQVRMTSMKGHAIDVDDILSRVSSKTKIVFIANPNNPTGTCLMKDVVLKLVSGIPAETLLVLDEAYAAFVSNPDFLSGVSLIEKHANIATVSTLSKSFGLAGIRIGFCIAGESMIAELNRIKPPFNMNILALKAGEAALKDRGFLETTLKNTWTGLDYLSHEASVLGLRSVPSETNFVLIEIGKRAEAVYEELLKRGIITRSMKSFGMEEYLRVTVGLPEENRAFMAALKDIL